MSRTRRARGFSLIEVMAVLFILGLILMAVVPSIDGLVPKYRLRGGARELAALIEEAQSQSIATRKEWNIAFDLDHNTYWLVMPPKDPEADPNAPAADPAAADPTATLTKEGRPKDDVEHGLPPPDPAAAQDQTQAEAEQVADRDSLEPTELPQSVVFERVLVGDDDKGSGVVYVPFSHLGGTGSVLVGLKLNEAESQEVQMWIRFNALTRTIEFSDQKPEVKKLAAASGSGP